MTYQVRITEYAEIDIFEIYEFISYHDSVTNAEFVLDKLENTISSLNANPNRGKIPPEMKSINISTYREILCYSWRIIYEVEEKIVWINGVFDGRRELQEALENRLLR